jgi:hypothetical protein
MSVPFDQYFGVVNCPDCGGYLEHGWACDNSAHRTTPPKKMTDEDLEAINKRAREVWNERNRK